MIVQMTREYTENMSDYHSNMRHLIHILEHITPIAAQSYQTRSTNMNMNMNSNNMRNTRNNGRSNFTSEILYRFLPANIRDQMHGYMEDVVVRPTQAQIDRAVEYFAYDPTAEYIEGRCPISLESFVEGEQLSRIRNCRHVFKQGVLNDWFSRNVHCPVCRYDIRDTPVIPAPFGTQSSNRDQPPTQMPLDDTINVNVNISNDNRTVRPPNSSRSQRSTNSNSNPIIETLGNALHTFIQNEVENNGIFNEMLYTFDIPILDTSSNYLFRN